MRSSRRLAAFSGSISVYTPMSPSSSKWLLVTASTLTWCSGWSRYLKTISAERSSLSAAGVPLFGQCESASTVCSFPVPSTSMWGVSPISLKGAKCKDDHVGRGLKQLHVVVGTGNHGRSAVETQEAPLPETSVFGTIITNPTRSVPNWTVTR